MGVMGLGLAWSLYFPSTAIVMRPLCAIIAVFLLAPVLGKYLRFPSLFFNDLRHPLNGSLMAPMTMCLLVIADYLTSLNTLVARFIWYPAMTIHISMMIYFFYYQLKNLRLTNLLPSWFLYPVGAISGTLAGQELGHYQFTELMTYLCISTYFVMLPIVLHRLCFMGRLPRPARPTLAIMAAPVNLSLTAYMVNNPSPDPILVGALAGIAITMTLLVYLCYFYLLSQRFHPSIAAITFPSVISSVAMGQITLWFAQYHSHWTWLHRLGFIELMIATGLVLWVCWLYIQFYFPNNKKKHAVQHS
ncbi:TDT family transporter [Vibrio sp. SS-MA-C1-2]|nr:TDT family transporter [Vibrio sp. SS-MA-C1-2]